MATGSGERLQHSRGEEQWGRPVPRTQAAMGVVGRSRLGSTLQPHGRWPDDSRHPQGGNRVSDTALPLRSDQGERMLFLDRLSRARHLGKLTYPAFARTQGGSVAEPASQMGKRGLAEPREPPQRWKGSFNQRRQRRPGHGRRRGPRKFWRIMVVMFIISFGVMVSRVYSHVRMYHFTWCSFSCVNCTSTKLFKKEILT